MSQTPTPNFAGTRRIKGSGYVFLDLGFDPAESKVTALRSELATRMEQHLKFRGWSQTQSAPRLDITQPRLSLMMRGRWQGFSPNMLLIQATRAGLELELRGATQSLPLMYATPMASAVPHTIYNKDVSQL